MPPIKPDEVEAKKAASIPESVFEVFNELITKAWNGYYATIKQDEVLSLIANRENCTQETILANHWLDIEEAYQKSGWKVFYDKPAYCESFPATFKFEKLEPRRK